MRFGRFQSAFEFNIELLVRSLEKYPSWPKGLPWKGSRSLIAARGFKSLLLRSFLKKESKKVLDKAKEL